MLLKWGRKVDLQRGWELDLRMGYCSAPGPCFFGMPAYLSDMVKQMEGKRLQRLSMSSLVDCKYTLNVVAKFVMLFYLSLIEIDDKKQVFCFRSALGQAAPNLAAIAKGRAAAANIFSMIETDSKPSRQSEGETILPEVAGKIEFCEVCFAYPSRPNMVFEDLSFSIDAGKTFAFVGHSGSGKSTIISMVQRFYDPISGKTKILD